MDPAAIAVQHGLALDERFAEADACATARVLAMEGLRARLLSGESLRLMCWCAPRRCHAEELVRRLQQS